MRVCDAGQTRMTAGSLGLASAYQVVICPFLGIRGFVSGLARDCDCQ